MSNDRNEQHVSSFFDFSERLPGVPPQINAIQRATTLLRAPESIWPEILQDAGGVREALLPYTVVVGLIPIAAGAVLSLMMSSFAMFFIGFQIDPMHTVFAALATYAYTVLCLLGSAKLLELIAPSFNLKPSIVLSTRVMVYCSTPALAMHLLAWIPFLGWMAELVGLWWSVRLMIQGSRILLKKPAVAEAPTTAPDLTGQVAVH